ncbi:MAG: hypothetical protein KBS66_05175, partial [Eubacterium sp.]|nr:hypothetical protein [Candidatus Colimonas fimequi]
MKYTELKVYGSSAGLELVTAIMLNHGIDYISVDDPDDFDEILNKKHEYGWDYIDDELKDSLDREPVLSVYFQDEEPAPSDSTVEITYDFSSTEGVGTAPDMEAILADIEELKEMVASGA